MQSGLVDVLTVCRAEASAGKNSKVAGVVSGELRANFHRLVRAACIDENASKSGVERQSADFGELAEL